MKVSNVYLLGLVAMLGWSGCGPESSADAGAGDAGVDAPRSDAPSDAPVGDAPLGTDASDDASMDASADAPTGDDAPTDGGLGDAPLDAPPALLNGCSDATAVDFTGMSAASVSFTAFAYTPACIRVSVGTVVTFTGAFASHPLQPGTIEGTTATPATGGPLSLTMTGTTASFTMPTAGAYPYYCPYHWPIAMMGVVYVVP